MNTCKHCYKFRWFHSKGALLVLVWIFLGSVASCSIYEYALYYIKLSSHQRPKWVTVFPIFFCLLGAVVSGWLADAKLGNYRVCKYGLWILFISTLFSSVIVLITTYFFQDHSPLIVSIMIGVGGSVFFIGVASCLVTSFQLGLDQMPDASSTDITSFIAWFVLTLIFCQWCAQSLIHSLFKCLSGSSYFSTIMQLYSLVPPLCVAIVLVLYNIFAPKWLLIEPKSPQSLRTLYQVLKFALKHKAPLNRSALTYWEEDVPSRMDLGKLRYGGPFTTEQVENVKTIIRLFVFVLSLLVSGFPLALGYQNVTIELTSIPNSTSCKDAMLGNFTYSPEFCSILCLLIQEFIVYPLFRNKLARISIIKKIGIFIFLAIVLNIVFLITDLVHYYAVPQVRMLQPALLMVVEISNGTLIPLMFCSILEFVCAQAPYNMRGFFAGYTVFLCVISVIFGTTVTSICLHSSNYCKQILFGVRAGVNVLGFILYCVLARWYKLRVRDEDYHPQPVVEEIYDRYLSAPS